MSGNAIESLSLIFPKPSPSPEHPLPLEFDDACRRCHRPMERGSVEVWTGRKPFALFQCARCHLRLMLFEAPRTPLILWSDALVSAEYSTFARAEATASFSDHIDRLIAARERKHLLRRKREEAEATAGG